MIKKIEKVVIKKRDEVNNEFGYIIINRFK